jgi:hypothetical protein
MSDGVAKIGDFGFSKISHQNQLTLSFLGFLLLLSIY